MISHASDNQLERHSFAEKPYSLTADLRRRLEEKAEGGAVRQTKIEWPVIIVLAVQALGMRLS